MKTKKLIVTNEFCLSTLPKNLLSRVVLREISDVDLVRLHTKVGEEDTLSLAMLTNGDDGLSVKVKEDSALPSGRIDGNSKIVLCQVNPFIEKADLIEISFSPRYSIDRLDDTYFIYNVITREIMNVGMCPEDEGVMSEAFQTLEQTCFELNA